jgi:hypothetical protein
MLKGVVISLEQGRREAAAREAQVLLRSARALAGSARGLLRWRPVAWAMRRLAEVLARMAWRVWNRDLRGRRGAGSAHR